MDKLTDWSGRISTLNASLQPIAQRTVDVNDPKWLAKLRDRPNPLDEAGVRSETESLVAEAIEHYPEADDGIRQSIRELFAKHPSFSWAANLPIPATTPEGFRAHLILFSINDQGRDSRDAVLLLEDLCAKAASADVDTRPILLDVAALCSAEDVYGMGSTRSLLINRAK